MPPKVHDGWHSSWQAPPSGETDPFQTRGRQRKHVFVCLLVCGYHPHTYECMRMHMFKTRVHLDHNSSTRRRLSPDAGWSDDCECLHPAAVMAARNALGEAPSAAGMATFFAILADSTRMRILIALGAGELCVTDLAAATGVNRTTISHQLRVLRRDRLVRRRRDGKVVFYALDDDHVMLLVRMATEHIAEDGLGEGGLEST